MPVTQLNTKAGRFYDVDGDLLPSVTTILKVIGKPALVHWAAHMERLLVVDAAADLYLDLGKTPMLSRAAYVATLDGRVGTSKAHKRALDKAHDIGTQAHKLIEWNLRHTLGQTTGPQPRVVDDVQWAFMAFEDWARAVNLKPRLIEQVVYSKTYRYAGTMDLLADVNDAVTLVDFKTSKGIYAEAFLQNVAYQVALAEMGHPAPTGGVIVRIPKNQNDPQFEVAVVPPVADLLPVFLAARTLWVWHEGHERAYRDRRETTTGTAEVAEY